MAVRFYRILITNVVKGSLIFLHALQIFCVLGPCTPLQLLQVTSLYFPTKQLCCFLSLSLLCTLRTRVHLCLPAPQNRVAFQELPKSLAVILKFTVEIVNEKSFRLAHVLDTAVQERQVMPQIKIFWKTLKSSCGTQKVHSTLQIQSWDPDLSHSCFRAAELPDKYLVFQSIPFLGNA